MANITKVDYESLPGQASSIRSEGKNLKENLEGLFSEAQNMHNNWYGIRYNSFITELNSMTPTINDILKLVIDEIPVALETVAKNYALADGAAPKAVNAKEVPSIPAIEPVTDVGLKYVSESVAANKTTIEEKIKSAEENLSNIEAKYSEIVWESEASQVFSSKFSSLKSAILTALAAVQSNLSKLMVAAEEDISAAETNNTVK